MPRAVAAGCSGGLGGRLRQRTCWKRWSRPDRSRWVLCQPVVGVGGRRCTAVCTRAAVRAASARLLNAGGVRAGWSTPSGSPIEFRPGPAGRWRRFRQALVRVPFSVAPRRRRSAELYGDKPGPFAVVAPAVRALRPPSHRARRPQRLHPVAGGVRVPGCRRPHRPLRTRAFTAAAATTVCPDRLRERDDVPGQPTAAARTGTNTASRPEGHEHGPATPMSPPVRVRVRRVRPNPGARSFVGSAPLLSVSAAPGRLDAVRPPATPAECPAGPCDRKGRP